MPIKNQHEWVLQEHHLEHPTGVSMTVPDQSMSIRYLFEKHVDGRHYEGTYDDEADFDSEDLSKLGSEDPLLEIDDFLKAQRRRTHSLKVKAEKLQAQEAEEKQKLEADKLDAAIKRREQDASHGSNKDRKTGASGSKEGGTTPDA